MLKECRWFNCAECRLVDGCHERRCQRKQSRMKSHSVHISQDLQCCLLFSHSKQCQQWHCYSLLLIWVSWAKCGSDYFRTATKRAFFVTSNNWRWTEEFHKNSLMFEVESIQTAPGTNRRCTWIRPWYPDRKCCSPDFTSIGRFPSDPNQVVSLKL